jgi:LPXTG-site transpeptidase (sortase) family protein
MRHFRHICAVFCSAVLLSLAACGSITAAQEPSKIEYPEQIGTAAIRTPPVTATQVPIDNAQPVRLSVPSISISAPIEQVQTLPNGDMATPTQNPWVDAGWYSAGPHPGDRGSSVIDGHLDRPGGSPAVFWYLRNMHVGDAVFVTEKDGKQLRFHVTHIVSYKPQDAPLQDIFGNSSGNFLNLITCTGDWIPDLHQTTMRLVVYTTLG